MTIIDHLIAGELLHGNNALEWFTELDQHPTRAALKLALRYLELGMVEQARHIIETLIETLTKEEPNDPTC